MRIALFSRADCHDHIQAFHCRDVCAVTFRAGRAALQTSEFHRDSLEISIRRCIALVAHHRTSTLLTYLPQDARCSKEPAKHNQQLRWV